MGIANIVNAAEVVKSAPAKSANKPTKPQNGGKKGRSEKKSTEVAATAPKGGKGQKNANKVAPATKGKKNKDTVVSISEHSRGGTGQLVRGKWRGFGSCELLRWMAANGFTNGEARWVLDQIGLSEVNDFTIGCQCGATRSAMNGAIGERAGKPISKADAARGVSFRGVPADVKGENAAFLKAVKNRKPAK